MLFPTYHEGLTICVLEAMAAGLIIVTLKVGGLVDLYNAINFGYITNLLDPSYYEKFLIRMNESDNNIEIKNNNRDYACNNFHPQFRAEHIYEEIKDLL